MKRACKAIGAIALLVILLTFEEQIASLLVRHPINVLASILTGGVAACVLMLAIIFYPV